MLYVSRCRIIRIAILKIVHRYFHEKDLEIKEHSLFVESNILQINVKRTLYCEKFQEEYYA